VEQQQNEQTLVLIKPDALKNSLTGYVLSQLSEFHTGLRFAAAKIVHVSTMLAGEHYAEHRGKFFFPSLLDYIQGRLHYANEPWKRRVIALVYQGPRAVAKVRELCGPTNPHVGARQAAGQHPFARHGRDREGCRGQGPGRSHGQPHPRLGQLGRR
jgi:nucleoside-diphosphate kinase